MPLLDSTTIDAMGEEEDSGTLVLALLDEVDWAEPLVHWQHLTEKLNRYLNFLVSGEVYEHYPDVEADRMRIGVLFRCVPPEEIIDALARSQEFVSSLGYALEWDVHEG